MDWLVLPALLVKWVKLVRLDSPEALAAKVIWAVPDRKEVKDCKVLEERPVNLEFPVNLVLPVQLVKMDYLVTRVVKEILVVLDHPVSPVLGVLPVLLVAPEFLVPRVIQDYQEQLVSRENLD